MRCNRKSLSRTSKSLYKKELNWQDFFALSFSFLLPALNINLMTDVLAAILQQENKSHNLGKTEFQVDPSDTDNPQC